MVYCFFSHLEMLILVTAGLTKSDGTDSRGDFQSPETEEMKKAMIRAIANRPYKQ